MTSQLIGRSKKGKMRMDDFLYFAGIGFLLLGVACIFNGLPPLININKTFIKNEGKKDEND